MTALGRVRALHDLVDELAPPGWRRDPAWWGLLGAVAVLEPRGRRAGPAYLVSNAEPSHDTFMAAEVPGPGAADAAPAWIAWAVTAAHAAVCAIDALDGTLPGQPLAVTIDFARGLASRAPLADRRRVGFAIGDRVLVGRLDPRGPHHDGDLVRALARALRGEPSQLVDGARPAVVIGLGEDSLARAHHGHRRAWTAAGGPWLGIARARGSTVVSTCHLVVDGHGHALLTRAITGAPVDDALAAEAIAAWSGTRAPAHAAAMPALAPLPDAAGEALSIAWTRTPPLPGFAHLGYALGRLLHRERGDRDAPRSPCFQLPVAPGARDDDRRFAHRVRPALLSVRFSDGRPEPFEVFAARAKAAVAREAQGAGLISRLLVGLAGIPLPVELRRRVLSGAPSRLASGPTELLCGDGCLSLLRLPGSAPLVAASAPPPQLPRTRSSSVATVVRDDHGATVTVAAAGPRPARELLAAWLTLVAEG